MAAEQKVLVTGGAGYIGSHACKALAAAGYTPVVFDNLQHGHRRAVKWGPLHEGDLRCASDIHAALRRHQPEAVLHFAALTSVAESMARPAAYSENNVTGTENLLAAMRACGVRKLVFSSSCAVYAAAAATPIAESAPLAPASHYGETKRDAERLLAREPGLRSISLRYFNAAGADPGGELGEAHAPETHLIPLVLRAAAEGTPVNIYGADYPTPDGTCVRDYVHVTDLARAHVQALAALENASDEGTRAYNLGAGRGHSVREVLAHAETTTGRKIQCAEHPRRTGDAPELIANTARAQKELAWDPKHSALPEIMQTAWAWHRTKTF